MARRTKPDPLAAKIGARVRALREEHGLTLEKLAYSTDFSKGQLSTIEKGLAVPTASTLNVLDLRIVIIGGGISAAPQFVFKAVESSVRARVLKPHKPGIKVLRAKLGNPAGIIGAASLVM